MFVGVFSDFSDPSRDSLSTKPLVTNPLTCSGVIGVSVHISGTPTAAEVYYFAAYR